MDHKLALVASNPAPESPETGLDWLLAWLDRQTPETRSMTFSALGVAYEPGPLEFYMRAKNELSRTFGAKERRLKEFYAITGTATPDDLLAAMEKLKRDSDLYLEAKAKIASIEGEQAQREVNAALNEAQRDRRLTPAMAEMFRENVASGDMTPAAVLSIVARMGKHPILSNEDGIRQGSVTSGGTWRGKAWNQLSGMDRHDLRTEDPDLYASMRADALGEERGR